MKTGFYLLIHQGNRIFHFILLQIDKTRHYQTIPYLGNFSVTGRLIKKIAILLNEFSICAPKYETFQKGLY